MKASRSDPSKEHPVDSIVTPELAARHRGRFEQLCQTLLHIGGREFIENWLAGKYEAELEQLKPSQRNAHPLTRCYNQAPAPNVCPDLYEGTSLAIE